MTIQPKASSRSSVVLRAVFLAMFLAAGLLLVRDGTRAVRDRS